MRKQIGVLTVLSCSLFSMNSFAADLYVDVNNSKATDTSNNGTNPSVPLKSITQAAKLATTAGTTVHVAPGIYNVSASSSSSAGISSQYSGNASNHIRFVSESKHGAKIVVTGQGYAWDIKGSYVDIDGFEIYGKPTIVNGDTTLNARIGIFAEGSNISITNNFVHDLAGKWACNGSGGSGILTGQTSGNILIADNIVRNISANTIGVSCNTVQGIYISSRTATVINNIVSGAAAVGIVQWHAATSSTIINNTVFHCAEGIYIGQGDGGKETASATNPDPGSKNNYVANNIVYDNLKYGIREFGLVAKNSNNQYVANLISKSGISMELQSGKATGTISKDPIFVNYQADGTGDYHQQPTSPGANAGTSISAPVTDLDGKPRNASDGHVDIGAYESGSSPTPPLPIVAAPRFAVYYSKDLKPQNAGCDGSAALSMACNAAIHHYCMNKGYDAGGFGPVEHAGDVAIIGCVKSGQASTLSTTFSVLKSNMTSGNTLCSSSNPLSTECGSAINRFCQSKGYGAGGFGPLEISGDNTQVTCVTSSEAVYRNSSQDTWATLQAMGTGCNGQVQSTLDVCKAAVSRRCQQLGYPTGYGILEMNSSVAYFSCLKY